MLSLLLNSVGLGAFIGHPTGVRVDFQPVLWGQERRTMEPWGWAGSLSHGGNWVQRWQRGAIALCLGLLLSFPWFAPPAIAATPPPAAAAAIVEPIEPTAMNSANIPSEKVTQFVAAYLQVVNLIDARSEELQRAETEAESLRVQQVIQAEAFAAIEATGLTQQEYWQLLGLANSDSEFRDRILAQLEEGDR